MVLISDSKAFVQGPSLPDFFELKVFSYKVAGLRVKGLGFRVQGSGFRGQGSGRKVQGLGLRV